MSMNLFSESI
jgi:hypothetical protein